MHYVLKRFGVRGAASAIEAKIEEHGGIVTEETVIQRGQRLKRAVTFATEMEQFRSSEAGVAAAKVAVESLLQGLAQHADELSRNALKFSVRALHYGYHMVASPNAILVLNWTCPYVNSLSDSRLEVRFFDKIPKLPGVFVFGSDDARTLDSARFEFKLVGPGRPAWVAGETEVAPDGLADHLMKRLMQHDEAELQHRVQR